ncbi:MAG: SpoIIE family protein phosphatase [Gammaproteobacteria bacterium]|nr:SpoIIE family protein phosphatase [Gammaproteobacteria bacterium]
MTILVMDDDDSVASPLIHHLCELGYEAVAPAKAVVAFAESLDEAQAVLCSFNGSWPRRLEAVRAIARGVPVLMTAPQMPPAEDLLAAVRAGADDFVIWPAGRGELDERIRANTADRRPGATDPALVRFQADLERDQRAGRQVQRAMLPTNPMVISGYRLSHQVRSSLLLSGDFVDYFRITDRQFLFYVADVSGHGASSAFLTVVLRNLSRRLRREFHPRGNGADPANMLVALNGDILDYEIDKHVAMFMGVVDVEDHTLTYANAGHFPHPVYIGADGGEFLAATGKPLGLFLQVSYRTRTVPFGVGDHVVVFSDGVLDAMDAPSLTAKEECLVECAVRRAPDIDAMWGAAGVRDATPGPDDMTCLVVSREPLKAEPQP